MIKIIAGKFKNKNILTPDTLKTIPSKSRVREAIFSILQPYIYESVVLDLFSGSGALGIEAISRDAKFVYFNDLDKNSYQIIQKNVQNLNILNNEVKNLDYLSALEYYKNNNLTFDIVFLDPPYINLDYYFNSIDYLIKNNLINKRSVLVLETNTQLDLSKYSNYFKFIKYYSYGYSKLYILRNI